MTYLTAQILTGREDDMYGNGYALFSEIFLFEHFKPVLKFHKNIANPSETDVICWISTVENIIDDAILMIALYEAKIQNIIKLAEQYCPQIVKLKKTFLYDIFTQQQRLNLYKACQQSINSNNFPELKFLVFNNSVIYSKINKLQNYNIKVDIYKK